MDLRNLTKKYSPELGPEVVAYLDQITGPNTLTRAACLVVAALRMEQVEGLHGSTDGWLGTGRMLAQQELQEAQDSGALTPDEVAERGCVVSTIFRPDALLFTCADLWRLNREHGKKQALARFEATRGLVMTADKIPSKAA